MSNFDGAGVKEGMELWRIEKFEAVRQPGKVQGKFHEGDAYILLVTSMKGNKFLHNLHFWIGEECSHDEQGAAAYKAVELDDSLGGGPVQYREVQGHESALFKSYFGQIGGIEYLPGGIESGFRKVITGVFPTRLLHLKGSRTVIVKEVKLHGSSLNKGDVFVLDAGHKIYIFNGPTANKYEKVKGIEVANTIDADERGGKSGIILIDDEPKNVEFWALLGGFIDKNSMPDGDADEEMKSNVEKKLFVISDNNGEVNVTEKQSKRLQRGSLESDNVMMIVSKGKIFLWIGKTASLAEKKESTAHAMQYIKANGMPTHTSITRVVEGCESAAFKQEFDHWTPPMLFGYQAKDSPTDEQDNVTLTEVRARKAVEDKPVDDGSGSMQIWVIRDFKKVEVSLNEYGQFYAGDSYIILYTYTNSRGKEDHIIYFWLGLASSTDEKGSAALLVMQLDDSMGGTPVQVRLTQGKEPAHFRQLFKGRMILYSGGNSSGFNMGSADMMSLGSSEKEQEDIALFRVKGTTPINTVAVQVPEDSEHLNGGDCFILVTPSEVYTWFGHGSNEDEQTVAVSISSTLAGSYKGTGGRTIVPVKEGEESADFWNDLGGKSSYPTHSVGEFPPVEPRMFHCSTATGRFVVDEVENFDQTDLHDEDVFIIDTYSQLFLWVGTQASEDEKKKAMDTAQSFISDADDGRDAGTPIIRVHPGSEPDMFSTHFVSWDADYIKKNQYICPYEAKLQKLAAEKGRVAPEPEPEPEPEVGSLFKAPNSIKVAYEAVKGTGNEPDGVDPSRKEEYLDKDTFVSLFKMTKKEFAALAKWKRDKMKRELGLF